MDRTEEEHEHRKSHLICLYCLAGFGNTGELGRPGTTNVPVPNDDPDAPMAFTIPYLDPLTGQYDSDVLRNYKTPTEVEVPGIFRRREVVQIACGSCHWLALVKQGNSKATEVYSLGCNGDGQLGLGDGANRGELTQVRKFVHSKGISLNQVLTHCFRLSDFFLPGH
jgi:alpha-tubulin suppressor-like RCC1 family protein